jgi:hypothetical protein
METSRASMVGLLSGGASSIGGVEIEAGGLDDGFD